MTQEEKIQLVKSALKNLYDIDQELFTRGLCERCLVHRLAVHLGNDLRLAGYIIDCEFNKSFDEEENTLKRLSSNKGNYVDIIVHKRSNPIGDNLICLEIKKASNRDQKAIEKDKANLLKLTTFPFFYTLGFFINLGNSFDTTQIDLYSQGQLITEPI